ncbi:hypothetical protein ACFL4W_04420, partial [Planctomycetota bacterium]
GEGGAEEEKRDKPRVWLLALGAGLSVLILVGLSFYYWWWMPRLVFEGARSGRTVPIEGLDISQIERSPAAIAAELIPLIEARYPELKRLTGKWRPGKGFTLVFRKGLGNDGMVDFAMAEFSPRYMTFDMKQGFVTHHGGDAYPELNLEIEFMRQKVMDVVRDYFTDIVLQQAEGIDIDHEREMFERHKKLKARTVSPLTSEGEE